MDRHIATVHEGKKLRLSFLEKSTINKHIESVHEGKSHSNVRLVNLHVLKWNTWGLSYQVFMKWISRLNVIFVIQQLQQGLAWNFISKFMKERNLLHATIVSTFNLKNLTWKYIMHQFMKRKTNVNFAYIAVTINAAWGGIL